MKCFAFYCIVLILSIFEANTQDIGRSIFELWKNFNIPQHAHRQGSIDEFIAFRPTTPKPNEYKPCIPHHLYPRRDKRSPHFRKKTFHPNYPVNIYQQNLVNKPFYNGFEGYHCDNHQFPVHQLGNNNYLTQFPNIFGGIFGTNSNGVVASPPYDNVRPVHENNGDDINPNEVRKMKTCLFFFNYFNFSLIHQWRPGKPVGGIQNIVSGHNQDLSSNRFPKFF